MKQPFLLGKVPTNVDTEEAGIKNRIDGILKELDSNASEDMLSTVNELCNAVYQGDLFDDKKYNELISYVQAASV